VKICPHILFTTQTMLASSLRRLSNNTHQGRETKIAPIILGSTPKCSKMGRSMRL
jgi:hypothetical protein